MKFGKYLEDNMDAEWAEYYLDYAKLKELIELITSAQDGAETKFVEVLEACWVKYKSFIDQWINNFDDKNVTKQSIIPIIRMNAFMYVNQECLRKIIKKHDKNSSVKLAKSWEWKVEYKPFFKLFEVMKKVSKLYKETTPTAPFVVDPNVPQPAPKHLKYWVPRERIIPLICLIIQYLPMKLFGEGDAESLEQVVNTVYLDNENMDTYEDVVGKQDDAENTQIRFYGDKATTAFIERTKQSDMLDDSCFASREKRDMGRFSLPMNKVRDLLTGHSVLDVVLCSVENPSECGKLVTAVAELIETQKLGQALTAEYKRITFELPAAGAGYIRCDLELDINLNKPDWHANIWDASTKIKAKDSEIYQFPFSVLEVTLVGDYVTEPPAWFDSLVNQSDLVIPQEFFSKFVHGQYMFNSTKAKTLPPWIRANMDYFESDIKTCIATGAKARAKANVKPASAGAGAGTGLVNAVAKRYSIDKMDGVKVDKDEHDTPMPVEDPENEVGMGWFMSKSQRQRDMHGNNSYSSVNTHAKGMRKSLISASPSTNVNNLCSTCGQNQKDCDHEQPHYVDRGGQYHSEFTLFLANESAFLQWFNSAVLMCAVGIATIAMGQRDIGIVLNTLGIITVLYAAYSYHRRDKAVRNPYHNFDCGDRFGPYFLTFGVVAAFVVALLIGKASN